MSKYLGDYSLASLVYFKFNTMNGSTLAPSTLAGTPSLNIFKNSTTPSTAGCSLVVDYNGVTGMHHATVDTSADGAFFASGNDFSVQLAAGTVGGVSVVGREIATFSLNNRSALRPATAGRTLLVDGSGFVTFNNTTITTVTGNVNGSVGSISGITFPTNFGLLGITGAGKVSEVVLTDTLTTYTGNTLQTGDSFARIGATGSGLTSLAPSATALSNVTWPNSLATLLTTLAGHDPGAQLGTSTLTPSQVKTQMTDALNVDTYAEPTGAPAATTTMTDKVGRLYQVLRNKFTLTANALTLYSDGGSVIWSKVLSDDGTTYTQAKGS